MYISGSIMWSVRLCEFGLKLPLLGAKSLVKKNVIVIAIAEAAGFRWEENLFQTTEVHSLALSLELRFWPITFRAF